MEQKKTKFFNRIEISLGEALFYAFWVIMILLKALGFYEGQLIYNVGLLLSFACIALKIVLEGHTLKEWILIALFLTLGMAIYLFSTEKTPMIYLILMAGMKRIDVKKTFRIGAWIWGVCFLLMAVAELSGLRTGLVLVHEKMGIPLIRWSFGYPHPNVLQITYAVIAGLILYGYEQKGWKEFRLLCLLMAGNVFVGIYSLSYTGIILTTFVLICFFYFDNRKMLTGAEKGICVAYLPAVLLFALGIPILIWDGMPLARYAMTFHRIFKGRTHGTGLYLSKGLHLFGLPQESFDTEFALDCSYANLLARDGLIFFLLCVGFYLAMILWYLKQNRRKDLALLISMLLAGITEPFLFNTSFKNLTMVLMGCFVWNVLLAGEVEKEPVFVGRKIEIPFLPREIRLKKIGIPVTLFILGIGLLVGIAGMTLTKQPTAIYVPAVHVDVPEVKEDTYSLDEIREELGQGAVLYGEESTMERYNRFDGTTLQVEKARTCLGWWMIGSLICYIILNVKNCFTERKKK